MLSHQLCSFGVIFIASVAMNVSCKHALLEICLLLCIFLSLSLIYTK
jgi:hypothetical protein